jgi:hypothetical protein
MSRCCAGTIHCKHPELGLHSGHGYLYEYHSVVPDSLAYADAEEAEKTLAIKDVEASG